MTTNHQRALLLTLAVALLLLLSGWLIWLGVQSSRSQFMTGLPPDEIRNAVLPQQVDLAKMRPPALRPTDPIRFGGATSVASVVEYGDFECAGCHEQEQAVRTALPKFGGRVRLVWRDLPIKDENPNAFDAAVFARCAGVQGKFWDAHDALFAAPSLGETAYAAIARDLRLNLTALAQCRADPAVAAAVTDDVDISRGDGVTSAPFLFIGTRAAKGPVSADEIEQELLLFLKS